MFKTILVPVVGASVDKSVFAAAASLARMYLGHIDLLYARPEPITMGAVYGGALIPGSPEELRAAADRQHAEVMRAYLEACRREQIPTDIVGAAVGRVTARWHRETGKVVEWVGRYGHASDIIVVERGSDWLKAQAIEGALFESGKPVLIPGLQPPSLDTVVVAWKPTREAGRAVGAALPLLAQAKRVVVVSVAEGGAINSNDVERLATMLRRHQPSVETVSLNSDSLDVSDVLLEHVYQAGAGLVIMGAYSRSRFRELILGGVTESVLNESAVPVLMSH